MYRITIEKLTETVKSTQADWQIVSKEGDSVAYGYPPAIERPVKENVKIYEQSVENLDMGVVVAAINGLK